MFKRITERAIGTALGMGLVMVFVWIYTIISMNISILMADRKEADENEEV